MARSTKHPMSMSPEEYHQYILDHPSPEVMVMQVLRESRFVSDCFPPYSSGAGDLVEGLLNQLRKYWGLPEREYMSDEWEWNRR